MVTIPHEEFLSIPGGTATLEGILALPSKPKGIIIFAHGAGSSRLSPRNTLVAQELQRGGFATLLFDLLTEEEDSVYANRFNIDLLTERLEVATAFVRDYPATQGLPFGYFGASTGAAAALRAAADLGGIIGAVVSRGGRPDLAMDALPSVLAPTLLIVGGSDEPVITLNRKALDLLNTTKELAIIPGATHLFEERGALEEVSRLALSWFTKYVGKQ